MATITVDDYVRSNLSVEYLKNEATTAKAVDYIRRVISVDPDGDQSVGLNDAGEPTYEPDYLDVASLVACVAQIDRMFGKGTGLEFVKTTLGVG